METKKDVSRKKKRKGFSPCNKATVGRLWKNVGRGKKSLHNRIYFFLSSPMERKRRETEDEKGTKREKKGRNSTNTNRKAWFFFQHKSTWLYT